MDWPDLIIITIALLNLILMSFKLLSGCIRIVAFQGILICLLPFIFQEHGLPLKTVFVNSLTIILKGFIFPWLFFRALKMVKIKKEVEPFISYQFSIIIGLCALFISFWLSHQLTLPKGVTSPFILPISFLTIFTGLFMIISRAKAITQSLGYLIMENGIYMFGYALLIEQPLLVELGIMLDIFVAIFIMGINIFHINKQFDRLDTRCMSQLKD